MSIKPLLKNNLATFSKRFECFKDAEFRSLEVLSPTTMSATFATQDGARAFDWITITLEFSGISDAKLLESSKLHLVDMSDGISLIYDNNFAFAIGDYNNISNIKNSISYIICTDLKYKEGLF